MDFSKMAQGFQQRMRKMQPESSPISSNTKTDTDDVKIKETKSKITSPKKDKHVVKVFENERWRDEIGWSPRNLELGDPSRYVSDSFQSDNFDEPEVPDGWEVNGEWRIDKEGADDEDGWMYGPDFRVFESTNMRRHSASSSLQKLVRRRCWIRPIHQISPGNGLDDFRDDGSSISGDIETKSSSAGQEKDGIDSETEDEQEDDEDYLNFLSGGESFASTVIRDPTLLAIGKQMRLIEAECRKNDDLAQKEWKKNILPGYKATVNELEKQIASMRQQMKSLARAATAAKDSGNTETTDNTEMRPLETELAAFTEACESTKQKMYLPTSTYTVGGGGFYLGFDDMWVENISGQFVLDLIPSQFAPQIIVLLTGTTTGSDSGVSVRVLMNGFKLRCDPGTGVPNLSFDSIKLTVVVRVTIMLTFNVAERKWSTNPKSFVVEILSFRGPFGTRRSLVSTILSLVSPLIREQLTKALPPELGLLLQELPVPFSVRGEFDLRGMELNALERSIFKSEKLCLRMGYTTDQMLRFMALQKSIDRGKMLRTMQDFLMYRKLGKTHHKQWDVLRSLWNQAAILYFEKANGIQSGDHQPDIPILTVPLSFERLLQSTEEILKKPITLQVSLHQVYGNISLMSILENAQRMFDRWSASQKTSNDSEVGDVDLVRYRIRKMLDDAQNALLFITQNLSFAHSAVSTQLNAGPDGEIRVNLTDIMAKVPMSMWITTLLNMSFGFNSPVPFVCALGLDADGAVNMELYHVGSEMMLQRTNYLLWREKVESQKRDDESLQDVDDSSLKSLTFTEKEDVQKKEVESTIENNDSPSVGTVDKPLIGVEASISTTAENVINSASEMPPIAVNANSNESNSTSQTETVADITTPVDAAVKDNKEVVDLTEGTSDSVVSPARKLFGEVDIGDESITVTESQTNTASSNEDLTTKEPEPIPSVTASPATTAASGSATSGSATAVASAKPTIRSKIRQSIFNAIMGPQTQAVSSDTKAATSVPVTDATTPVKTNSTYAPQATQTRLKMMDESYASKSEKQKRELKRVMDKRPEKMGGTTVGIVRVFQPNVSIVVDDAVSLEKGTELLSFSLNAGNASENGKKAKILDEDDADNNNKPKAVMPSSTGCKIHLQTAKLIKLQAIVPSVTCTIKLAPLIRFFAAFLNDFDALRDFIGVTTELGRDVVDEHMHLAKVLIERLSKYILSPGGLELDVNIFGKLEATDSDLLVSFSTLDNPRKTSTAEEGSSYAIHVVAKANVMDLIADISALKVSIRRCEKAIDKYLFNEGQKDS